MLPDRVCKLLTAYVDGELDADGSRRVELLIQRLPEARRLLDDLRTDADLIKNLPRLAIEPPFVLQLQDQAVDAPAQRTLGTPAAMARTVPGWVGMALAASILVVVSTSSYLVFRGRLNQAGDGTLAGSDSPELIVAQKAPSSQNQEPETRTVAQIPIRDVPTSNMVAKAPAPAGNATPVAPDPATRAPAPVAPLTSPIRRTENIRRANVKVAYIVKCRALDEEKHRKALLEELQKADAYHAIVSCRQAAASVESLRRALAARGIRLLIDADAQDRLKLRLPSTEYAVYLENVQPDEIAQMFAELRKDDSLVESRPKGQGQFENLKLDSFAKEDDARLVQLMGLDRDLGRTTRSQVAARVRRLPAGLSMVAQLASAVTPDSVLQRLISQTVLMEKGRAAILVTSHPDRSRRDSPEVVRFMKLRTWPHDGTIQILLTLRPTQG